MRISNSFSEGEIQVLDFIVQTLLRGGTPSMATRHKEFASLCRKVIAMKAKVAEKNKAGEGGEKVSEGRTVPEESSVGTVASPQTAQGGAQPSTGTDDDLARAV